jgi:hypothetical protein
VASEGTGQTEEQREAAAPVEQRAHQEPVVPEALEAREAPERMPMGHPDQAALLETREPVVDREFLGTAGQPEPRGPRGTEAMAATEETPTADRFLWAADN